MRKLAEKKLKNPKKGFSVMKGFFRLNIETEHTRKYVEYAPSVQGALPAFLHQAKNLQKFLQASFEIHHMTRIERKPFNAAPYRREFGTTTIDDTTWQHAFNAMNVSSGRSYNKFSLFTDLLFRKP